MTSIDDKHMPSWIPLESSEQLDEIISQSNTAEVLIFKHSTRCSISSMAKSRIEREWQDSEVSLYLLDLITFRAISNDVADRFGVEHQSPQVLLIDKGESRYDASHTAISWSSIPLASKS